MKWIARACNSKWSVCALIFIILILLAIDGEERKRTATASVPAEADATEIGWCEVVPGSWRFVPALKEYEVSFKDPAGSTKVARIDSAVIAGPLVDPGDAVRRMNSAGRKQTVFIVCRVIPDCSPISSSWKAMGLK